MTKGITPGNQFILLLIAAFVVGYLPLVKLPFLWTETFFHELSHGLMAIMTGGSIYSITLNYNGAGLCVYNGGHQALVSFAGYAGSGLWGLLIYLSVGRKVNVKPGYIAYMLVLMFATVLLFWANKLSTFVILIVLLSLFVGLLIKKQVRVLKLLIQFTGIFVMLDAIRSPLYLIDGKDRGDGAALSNLSWLPEIAWVLIWVVISIACLIAAWKYTRSNPGAIKV